MRRKCFVTNTFNCVSYESSMKEEEEEKDLPVRFKLTGDYDVRKCSKNITLVVCFPDKRSHTVSYF